MRGGGGGGATLLVAEKNAEDEGGGEAEKGIPPSELVSSGADKDN